MEITQGILTFDFAIVHFVSSDGKVFVYSSVLVIYSQVQWDDPASSPRPDRISPWEIEPLMASVPTSIQPAVAKYKRPRLPSEVPDFGKDAQYFISYNRFHFKCSSEISHFVVVKSMKLTSLSRVSLVG